ncbi:MAG TPA: AtpZ/AtpI family protein [Dehalococcoidia bacterium]|jgi:F0F1-type ATP synthase assembly protein I
MQRLTPAIQLLGLGSFVATCIVGATIGGFFVDKALDTGRVFTLVGLALGLVMAGYGAYRLLSDTIRDTNRWQAEQATLKKRKK